MGLADERHQVVLADACHGDVADHDHLVVAFLEHRPQDLGRVLAEAGGDLGVHAGDPGRGVAEAVAVEVLADPFKDQADTFLDPLLVEAVQSDGEPSWARAMPASSRERPPLERTWPGGGAMMPRAGRLTTGARIWASSSLPMVSFSISASTMASATSR
jgi:hypothetical protein